jgi:hypothetical protein
VDWNGRTVGWLTLPPSVPAVSVSVDGALVEIADPTGGVSVVDAGGRLVTHLNTWARWSSDGAHVLCTLDLGGPGPRLDVINLAETLAPGQSGAHPAQPEAEVHQWPETLGTGWELWGCSAHADRLVAVRFEHEARQPYALSDVAVLSLSGGRLLSHLTYPNHSAVAIPSLSADGRYLAEPDSAGRWTAIRDLRTGELVGRVRGAVAAFSGGGELVLTNGGPESAPVAAIVDWRWGRPVWAAAGQAVPVAVRPGGRDFVISLGSRTLMVWADGQALDVGSRSGPITLEG